jgi:P pilus assembly chaperone PapD
MFESGFGLKCLEFVKTGFKSIFIPGFVVVSSLFSGLAYGQGNLLISPRRIVFDGSTKTQEINLANTGKDTARYLISVMEIRMKDDGAFEEILQPDEGQNFASKYLRFFPRSVVLAPNEAQTIKVQLNKATGLPEGEYRSHIYFRAVASERPLGEREMASTDTSNITVNIKAVFGITIPAIIRIGENNTKVSISNIALTKTNDTTNSVQLTLNRTGNMSTYADIVVYHIGADGSSKQIGAARGVAVYSPNKLRNFSLNLDRASKIDLHKGKLKVTYEAQKDDKSIRPGKSPVLAESEITLQ